MKMEFQQKATFYTPNKVNIMKHLFIICLAISSFGFAQNYSIMSYNIKLDYPKEGKNSWTNRKPFMINQIKFYEPDVLGVQEALPNQMKDLDSLLTDYSFVGVGRDNGKNEGEFSAIFFKKNKFNILKSSTFWLSETPKQVSRGWDAAYNRICTYALLEDKISTKTIWVFNTHFDHVGKIAKKKSVKLILEKMNQLNDQNSPKILMGDFNLEPETELIQSVMQEFADSKAISKLQFGPKGTFNGFKFNQPVTRRIDYIFVSDDIRVNKYNVPSDNWNLQYPSDHLPIYIEVTLNK